jgi:hypothetical protein
MWEEKYSSKISLDILEMQHLAIIWLHFHF